MSKAATITLSVLGLAGVFMLTRKMGGSVTGASILVGGIALMLFFMRVVLGTSRSTPQSEPDGSMDTSSPFMASQTMESRLVDLFGLTQTSGRKWDYQGAIEALPPTGLADLGQVIARCNQVIPRREAERGFEVINLCVIVDPLEPTVVVGAPGKAPFAFKTRMPIRSQEDLSAIVSGLVQGTKFKRVVAHTGDLIVLERA